MLSDISECGLDEDSSWKKWTLGAYPKRLEAEAKILLEVLQGKSPYKVCIKDKEVGVTPLGNTQQLLGIRPSKQLLMFLPTQLHGEPYGITPLSPKLTCSFGHWYTKVS